MTRKPFFLDEKIYSPTDIKQVLNMAVNDGMTIGNTKGYYYFNIPCAFDIETTSFYIDNDTGRIIDYKEKIRIQNEIDENYEPEKAAIMYIWQFGINGRVIIGRTWQEFITMLDFISKYLKLNESRKLVVYVHNLGFEFQFMRKWLEWEHVFSIEKREPLYATTKNFIEFRCSLKLSNYSLANLANQLQKYKVKKLVGELDYSLIRNSKTVLTDREIAYCVNDVRVVMCYIQEKIENENGLQNIPLTQTGYPRKYCRQKTLYLDSVHNIDKKYKKLIHELNINDMNEYRLIQDCFQGGFTHANAYYSGELLKDVASYDFTSSYPYIMVSEKFPMSTGKKIDVDELTEEKFNEYVYPSLNKNKCCCIMNVTFINLIQTETHENPLSVSKCKMIKNEVVNNGRVVCCDFCNTSITNIDFIIFKQFYRWDKMIIREFYVYYLQYLPTKLVNAILDLYEQKTTLKGVKGKEVEYLRSKEMINSVYGMSVTNPLRDEIYIDENHEWKIQTYEEWEYSIILERENKKQNRFLFYLWGVFVTAYARRNLFTAIKNLEWDYVYSDTDSVKLLNHENHSDYFEAYNENVMKKLEKAAKYHKIKIDRFSPKTIKGEIKTLGLWDYEGTYQYFKTLGAKRYCVSWYNERTIINGVEYPISITVAGLNKKYAIPYIFDNLAKGDLLKVFECFDENLHVPPEFTGKMTHLYIDYEQKGIIEDYQGNIADYHEKSSVHLEPASYDLSLARKYVDYLRGIKDIIV